MKNEEMFCREKLAKQARKKCTYEQKERRKKTEISPFIISDKIPK